MQEVKAKTRIRTRAWVLAALLAVLVAGILGAGVRIKEPVSFFRNVTLPTLREPGGVWQGPVANYRFDDSAFYAFADDLQCDAASDHGGLKSRQVVLDQKLQAEPLNPYVWYAYAALHMRRESNWARDKSSSLSEAMTMVSKALSASDPLASGHIMLAKVYLAGDDPFNAYRHLNEARGLGAPPAAVDIIAGQLHLQLNRYPQAEQDFSRAIQEPSSSVRKAHAAVLLGDMFSRLGESDRAERQYRFASSLQTCSTDPERRLAGFLLFARQDRKAAETVLRDSMARMPHPETRRLLSLLLFFDWSEGVETGRDKASRARELAQQEYVTPEEILLAAARFDVGQKVVAHLLKSGIVRHVDTADGGSNTALIIAAEGNALSVAATLMDRGANVDAQNALGQRALGFFAGHGNTKAVMLLTAKRAKLNYTDANGDSPLRLAVKRGRAQTAEYLLDHGARDHLHQLLFESALRGDFALTKMLIKAGVNVNSSSDGAVPPPMIGAIFSRDLPTIRLLLEAGADASASFRGRRIYEYAIDTGDPAVVEVLAKARKSAV